METISVSKFKATCLALLERIHRTGEPVLVTKKGKPLALVTPPAPEAQKEDVYGCMRDATFIQGDIISPLPEEAWEVLRS